MKKVFLALIVLVMFLGGTIWAWVTNKDFFPTTRVEIAIKNSASVVTEKSEYIEIEDSRLTQLDTNGQNIPIEIGFTGEKDEFCTEALKLNKRIYEAADKKYIFKFSKGKWYVDKLSQNAFAKNDAVEYLNNCASNMNKELKKSLSDEKENAKTWK